MHEVTQATISSASRKISNDLFGREYQLEVASAAAGLEAGFLVEDLVDEVGRRAHDAGVEVPKQSAIRKSLARLVEAGVIDMLPAPRRGSPAHYTAAPDSGFWLFAVQLYARA